MTGFRTQLRNILDRAGREATLDGSSTVEAQHVLLAIAADPATTAGRVLTSVGLDHRAIRDALDREHEHSLGAAGVSLSGFDLPPRSEDARGEKARGEDARGKKARGEDSPGGDPRCATRLGASVRIALERGLAGVRRNPQPAHLLLGILQAQVGTVPRTLALTGIDQTELTVRLRQALANPAG